MPSFVLDKYQYDETTERHVGINRVWAPDGKYIDLKEDEVKQYLSYELMSAPTLLRTYGEHSKVEYS